MRFNKQTDKSCLFDEIYNRYCRDMLKAAYDVLRDPYLSEDAVHDAFLKLEKNMDKVGPAESMKTKHYMMTIVRNAAIDIYRKRRSFNEKEVSVDKIDEIGEPSYEDINDEKMDIRDAFSKLPDIYKEVVVLKYSCCIDNDEIAETLGINEGTVRQRLSRAKQMMQEMLK